MGTPDARLLAALPPLGEVATVRRALHNAELDQQSGIDAVRRLVDAGKILIDPPAGLTMHTLIGRLP